MRGWIFKGYQDGREGNPGRQAPDVPEDVLYLCEEQAPADVREYWQGWGAGISDNVRDILKSLEDNHEKG